MDKSKLKKLLLSQGGVLNYRKITQNQQIHQESCLYDLQKKGCIKDEYLPLINIELLKLKQLLDEYFYEST